MFFANRTDAGEKVARAIMQTIGPGDHHVVGLARGGVPIGFVVAQGLGSSLSSLLIDDIVSPQTGKQIFVTPFGDRVLFQNGNYSILNNKPVADADLPDIDQLLRSVRERHERYNGPEFEVGRKVILCDDGVVSGKTVLAATLMLRHRFGVEHITLAVPVVPRTMEAEHIGVDELIFHRRSSLSRPATGMFYDEFADVPDEEVVQLVMKNRTLH